MDQSDPWQVVPRQVCLIHGKLFSNRFSVFTTYDCLLISVTFVVLCLVAVSV